MSNPELLFNLELPQIYYKLENYEDAVDIYKALVKNTVVSPFSESSTKLKSRESTIAFKK